MNQSENFELLDEIREDNNQTDELIVGLGIPNGSSKSFEILSNMMTIYSPISDSKSKTDKIIEENRNEYLLESLIEAVNYEPTEETIREEEFPQLRRANAIDILTNGFPQVLEKNPEGAHNIIEAIMQRLAKKDPNIMKREFRKEVEDPIQRAYGKETSALIGFILEYPKYINSIDNETDRVVLKQIFGTFQSSDFNVKGSLMSITEKLFKAAAETKNYSLFNTLLNELIENVKKVNTSTLKGMETLVDISPVFTYLLSMERNLDPDERWLVDKKIYDFLTSYRRATRNTAIRKAFSRSLWTLIGDENRAEQSSKLLEQQRKFDLEELEYSSKSLNPHDCNIDANYIFETINFLNGMFEGYINGSSSKLFKLHRENQKDNGVFEEALSEFIYTLESKNLKISSLSIFNDISLVEKDTNPFKREVLAFYIRYFTKLQKKAK